ncbi:adenosine receptor A2a-like [Oculina patagonica]
MDVAFNNTENVDTDGKYQTSSVITAVCLIVISALAFGGNLLVLAAVAINRNLRSISDLFLANLAVADLCQAAMAIPLRVAVLLEASHERSISCHVVVCFAILFGGASNINILLVSVDRFIAIKWPFNYNSWVTMKLFICSLAISWLSLIVFAILPLVGWGRSEGTSSPTCRFTATLNREYVATGYVLIHGFPLITIIIFYLFILKASFRHSRAIAAQEFSLRTNNSLPNEISITHEEFSTNGEQIREKPRDNLPHIRLRNRVVNSNRRGKGARMIAVLLGVFIILVLPIIVIDVVEMWKAPFAPPAVVNATVCLIYANSGVNVFIYAGWNTEYKRTFRLVLVALWNLLTSPFS